MCEHNIFEGTINDDPFGGAFVDEGVVSKVPTPYFNSSLSFSLFFLLLSFFLTLSLSLYIADASSVL